MSENPEPPFDRLGRELREAAIEQWRVHEETIQTINRINEKIVKKYTHADVFAGAAIFIVLFLLGFVFIPLVRT